MEPPLADSLEKPKNTESTSPGPGAKLLRGWVALGSSSRKIIWSLLGIIVITGLVLLISWLISRNSANSSYSWGWYTVLPWNSQGMGNSLFLLQGFLPTIGAAFMAFMLSSSIGLVIALIGFIPAAPARIFNRVWVEALRAVPILVMLLWVYYGLAISIGLNLDLFTATVLAMALCDSAFEAEIFRGGIQSIGKDQHESARAIGLTPWQTMRIVVLPQAIRRILPPLGNQFVYMLKVSSLASVIGFGELTRKANELITTEYRPLEIYTFLIVEYLLLILVASALVRLLERKLRESYSE